MPNLRDVLLVGASCAFTTSAVVVRLSHVDGTLTTEDREVLGQLDLGEGCEGAERFEDVVTCVRGMQTWLAWNLPDLVCRHEWGVLSHEPGAYLERAGGCCYDRARLIEKALDLHGLEYRHVSLFATDGSGRSHATVEVRTERGWMVVDSVEPWIGLGTDGSALDARQVRAALRAGEAESIVAFGDTNDSSWWRGAYVTVYGVYSRHGGFYAPFAPIPDVDWAQVHHNLGGF